MLAQRLGLDAEPLLLAQRALMAPFVAFLEARLEDVDPIAEPTEATVLHFRLETAQTTVRFIDHMLDNVKTAAPPRRLERPRRAEVPEALDLGLLVRSTGTPEPVEGTCAPVEVEAAAGIGCLRCGCEPGDRVAPSAGVRSSGPMMRLNRGSASRIPGCRPSPDASR